MFPQLTLEWSLLSKYTGNDTYIKLAEESVLKIVNNVSIYTPLLDYAVPESDSFQPMPLPGGFSTKFVGFSLSLAIDRPSWARYRSCHWSSR